MNQDEPIGQATIDDLEDVNLQKEGSYAAIFPFDTIRRDAALTQNYLCTMIDESFEGRRMKKITFTSKNKHTIESCFWIDLKRGGHVVRQEGYGEGGALQLRVDVKLASFRVGDADVWMPVSGVLEDHTADKDGKTIYSKEPTSIETVYIIHGTLEFNKHPGPKTFTIAYKPGTPISDNIRKLKSEFGRQKTSPLPSRAEATAMLNEQVRQAEEQRKELLAGSPTRDAIAWSSWLIPVFGGAALVGSVVLLVRRGRG